MTSIIDPYGRISQRATPTIRRSCRMCYPPPLPLPLAPTSLSPPSPISPIAKLLPSHLPSAATADDIDRPF